MRGHSRLTYNSISRILLPRLKAQLWTTAQRLNTQQFVWIMAAGQVTTGCPAQQALAFLPPLHSFSLEKATGVAL